MEEIYCVVCGKEPSGEGDLISRTDGTWICQSCQDKLDAAEETDDDES